MLKTLDTPEPSSTRKPQGYWYDFANVKRELLAFIKKNGKPGVMPTTKELRRAGRSTLEFGISKHSGRQVIIEQLGLTPPQRQASYWRDFANVKRELLVFIKEHGTSDVMPTRDELTKAGRGDLNDAIQQHGGQQSVAERLGLNYARKWKENSSLLSRNLPCLAQCPQMKR
ncbi:MAG TPA: hypothetical protein VGX03_31915 [Candidatus Binatia bacterium]|jgi:hypothetical protein|nr:hypothetical protein [Candidatus Binatia bacterium]